MLTLADKGVGGVWTPPLWADIICEQPLTNEATLLIKQTRCNQNCTNSVLIKLINKYVKCFLKNLFNTALMVKLRKLKLQWHECYPA